MIIQRMQTSLSLSTVHLSPPSFLQIHSRINPSIYHIPPEPQLSNQMTIPTGPAGSTQNFTIIAHDQLVLDVSGLPEWMEFNKNLWNNERASERWKFINYYYIC